jgi:hypothetical protein
LGPLGSRASVPINSTWLMSNMVMTGNGTINSTTNVANQIYVSPYVPQRTVTYTGLSVNVGTAVASTNVKILVYNDLNGLPNTKIIESTALSKATLGLKTFVTSGTFSAGVQYWIGVVHDTTTGSISWSPPHAASAIGFLAASPTVVYGGFIYASSYASPVVTMATASISGLQSTGTLGFPIVYFNQ